MFNCIGIYPVRSQRSISFCIKASTYTCRIQGFLPTCVLNGENITTDLNCRCTTLHVRQNRHFRSDSVLICVTFNLHRRCQRQYRQYVNETRLMRLDRHLQINSCRYEQDLRVIRHQLRVIKHNTCCITTTIRRFTCNLCLERCRASHEDLNIL